MLRLRRILVTLFCLAWASEVEGQNCAIPTTFSSFRDYFYYRCNDPDNLEHLVYSHRNKPRQFLNELIWLEMCRFTVSDHFGRDLETIRSLSVQQRFPLGIAVYNSLQGRSNRKFNLSTAINHLNQALTFFKQSKDTTGLIYVQIELTKNYLTAANYDKKSLKYARSYFNNAVTLIQISTYTADKLMLLKLTQTKNRLIKYLPQDQERDFQQIYSVIRSDAKYNGWLRFYYAQYAEFLMRESRYEEALPYALKVLSFFTNSATYQKIGPYTRVAKIYFQLKKWHQAETYYLNALANQQPHQPLDEDKLIACYQDLITINSELKRLDKLLPLLAIKDSIYDRYNQNIRSYQIAEVQKKLEVERDKIALELKNQLVQSQNKILTICLLGLILLGSPIIYLLFKLQQRNTELKELQAARDQFYTIIAHDLRTPVNSMQGVGQLIRNLLKQDRKDDIEKIFKQIDLMEQHSHLVLDNLMEWGKLQYFENISSTSQQKIDLKPRIEEIVQYYLPIAQAKGIDISTNLSLSFVVQTDVKGLVIVLRNLIDNAIKYTPKNGKIVVSTKAEPYSQAAGKVTYSLTVADTGEGIPPEKLYHLKQVFSQKIKAEVGMGLGLGMVLIEHFVRKNKASVSIDSTLGQGTSISIQFA